MKHKQINTTKESIVYPNKKILEYPETNGSTKFNSNREVEDQLNQGTLVIKITSSTIEQGRKK